MPSKGGRAPLGASQRELFAAMLRLVSRQARHITRRYPAEWLAAGVVVVSVGCTLFVDTGDLAGSAPPVSDAPPASDAAPGSDAAPNRCTCAPTPLVGWVGPFARKDGPREEVPCPPTSRFPVRAYEGNTGLQNDTAECTPCSCSARTSCSLSLIYYGTTCPNFSYCNKSPSLKNGECVDLGPSVQGCSGSFYISSSSGGTGCTVEGGANIAPAPRWTAETTLCATADPPQRQDCAAGEVCVPEPPQGFQRRLCVASAGDKPCPGAPYTQRELAYSGFVDKRACSPCMCNKVSSGECATLNIFSDSTCSTNVHSYSISNACRTLDGTYARTELTKEGSCAVVPDSGAPTGGVTLENPTTICCTL